MRIVIRGTNWIGDAVMTLPAIASLRAQFPDSHIALQTGRWAMGVFDRFEAIDEIIPLEAQASRVADVRHRAAQLRERHFDVAILFTNSFSSALSPFLARIPRRIGFAGQHRSFLLTDAIATPAWKATKHESLLYQYLVDSISERNPVAKDSVPAPKLAIAPDAEAASRKILAANGVDDKRPLIAIGAGSTNSNAKRWPAASFAALCQRFTDELGSSVVLLGAPSEKETSAKVVDGAGMGTHDLTGKTTLSEVAAILSVADLFVSNDMGLAHLSAAVGTPTLVIFGPTNEAATRPLGENVSIVREPVDCAPCMLRECPIDHRCMTRISPDRVFDAAVGMIRTK